MKLERKKTKALRFSTFQQHFSTYQHPTAEGSFGKGDSPVREISAKRTKGVAVSAEEGVALGD